MEEAETLIKCRIHKQILNYYTLVEGTQQCWEPKQDKGIFIIAPFH